jgi:hypothetical protein
MTSPSFTIRRTLALLVVFTAFALPCLAQPASIALPKPRQTGGKSLMEALAARQTTRTYSDKTLSTQMLSDLVWAAFGVNRTKTERPGPGRTAPSGMNKQEVDLYLALPEGVYLYEAEPHQLKLVAAGDHRAKVGPDAAAKAAVTIVYVADGVKAAMPGQPPATPGKDNVNVGFIGQNVYLFAASEGLGAWFRASIPNEPALIQLLKLRADQKIQYVQTVGYKAS